MAMLTQLVTVLVRSLKLSGHVIVGLFLGILVGIEGGRRLSREHLGTWWHRRLLRILNVQLRILGHPLNEARVLACNHISWLDIHVVGACEPTRFVSKAEVRHWPVAGWLANAAGTFYLKRGAGGTRLLIDAVSRQLATGSVTFFPEGTTTDGDRVLRFQPRLFAAPIEAGRPVQPVTLRYGRAASGENIAPFVGEMTLTRHLRRLLHEQVLDVELIYCDPIDSRGLDRTTLARMSQDAVAKALVEWPGAPRKEQRFLAA